MSVPRVLKELLSLPTATFVEDRVAEYVKQFCSKRSSLSVSQDRFGNLLVRYCYRPARKRPLVFSAHMDHPAFVAEEMIDKRTLRAAFRGGVRSEYFTNAKVRFQTPQAPVSGRVLEITKARKIVRGGTFWHHPEQALLRVNGVVEPNTPGMWSLPAARERGDKLYAPDCDDIAGCAAMLAMLDRLAKRKVPAETYCLFTRAEEVGFVGAIAAAKAGTISKKWPIIAIETSSELPNARIGDGPILRVGDRMSVFDTAVTAFCGRVANGLAKKRRTFKFQRKLMDGGACESTAFCAYGYRATGICLALGAYHNMDTKRQKIAPEYISLSDWKLMVDWFEHLVRDPIGYQDNDPSIRADLDQIFNKWKGYF